MHIKSITISNFRSFRQQPEIESFSPGTNSIIGRNGSGKSNLFDAVQFCLLAPKFANLRQEERQALLHEGSGSAAVNAFVEIVFDNSDHRFQHENSDEVVLRRTIGLKKDEFFLQRKRATKAEIQSLLEGAGFSKSNPYFIVQQGKIQDLCTMSDAARLNLLKEVAGTTVYDEKKAESLAKMEENNTSIQKISEMLHSIEERLAELETEKDELTNYQNLDRARRAAQYALYSLELQKALAGLEVLEQDRSVDVEKMAEIHQLLKQTHEKLRNAEAILKTKANHLRRNRQKLQALEVDKNEAVAVFSKLDLECQDLQKAVETGEETILRNQKLLKDLEKEIAKAQAEMANIQPLLESEEKKLQDMIDERESAKKQTEALYAKQGRGRMFQNKAERDSFLESNAQELETTKAEKESELASQQDNLASLRRQVQAGSNERDKLQAELNKLNAAQANFSKSIDEKKRQRLELHESRKADWRQAEELQEQVREARDKLHMALSDIKKVMPRATAMGIEALNRIVELEGMTRGQQYFGMLMENFELVNEKYRTAVEVAAQNSLFHVIVDNDHTAAKLMKRLEEEKLGRVTFLPLNQLRIDPVSYPESNDVKPLLQVSIRFDKKVERAMQHVFSRKLLARDSESAAEWATKVSMDAITLDGDLCSRKGALTGGFIDVQKSRLRAYSNRVEAQHTLTNVEHEYQEMNRKVHKVDQAASTLMQELQRLESKQSELKHKTASKENDLERIETRLENQTKQIETIEKMTIPPLERSIVTLQADIQRLREEIGTELQLSLTDDDRTLLQDLKTSQELLAKAIEAQQEKVEELNLSRQKLQSLLENNLFQRRRELTEGIENDNNNKIQRTATSQTPRSNRRASRGGRLSTTVLQDQLQHDLEERRLERDAAHRSLSDLEERLEDARKADAELRVEVQAGKNEISQLQEEDSKHLRLWEESNAKAERYLTKRLTFTAKRESNMRKIQELGSLPPPSELKNYEKKSVSLLEKALDTINNKLKKYSHVNKKAYDQYVNFSDTRERLMKRKEELDHGAEKVEELIENLDQKKDEAINRTFRGVSSHFKDVFKELVPTGAGELIMRTALDDDEDDSEGTENDDASSEGSSDSEGQKKHRKKTIDKNNPDVSLYRGVRIKVRFSEVGENFMMSQLSGGQKSLVALALIFAIQRCDPAPFYLFDELDQALDSTYRAAVANLIQRQSNDQEFPTQFIVSTFRQELVAVANRCFGVSHQNKVSNLHHLSKRDAQAFIAELLSEEEAVGEVTGVASSRTSRDSKKRKTIEAA
jgi:structural maintenance of chromosome 3 (chondroitin sulfate proteoglycan 6)